MRHDIERGLIEDLARLRQEPPFSVDVTARVLAEVCRIGPPRPAIASGRLVGWSAAAALLLASGLALLAVPGFPGWLGDAALAAARAAGLGGSFLRFVAEAPGAAARALAAVLEFLTAFRGLAAVLAPAVAGATAAALMGMAGITAYVVGRDLRHGRAEVR